MRTHAKYLEFWSRTCSNMLSTKLEIKTKCRERNAEGERVDSHSKE